MARTKNTKTHNIYLLNKEKVQEKYFNGELTDDDSIINRIISEYSKIYYEQDLKEDVNTGLFHVRMYFHKEKIVNNKLASFCCSFIKEGQEIVTFIPCSASSVMFVWSKEHIFVITTGQGFRVVEDLCIPKFGMLVVSIFQSLFRITALDSNDVSGIIHSNKTIYANEIDFIDVDALDTVFKEITGRLNDEETVHSLLNLDQTSKKKSMKITAKKYVQFSSSLNFNDLIHLLTKIDSYNYDNIQDGFNLISPISPKQNKDIVEANNKKIIEKIFTAINENSPIGVDLFHRFTNDFIGADTYYILNDNKEMANTDDIESTSFIKKAYTTFLKGQTPSLESFEEFVNNAKLISYKGDNIVTTGSLLSHISGEIEVNNKNYYIFYGEYYYLSESYCERLDKSLGGKLLKDRFVNYLSTHWNEGETEDIFNERASNNEGFIHLHKVKPELIEFADLLKIDNDKVIVVHVKDGFNDDMRALDRQVELSINQVLDLKNRNSDIYMRKLYKNATKCAKGRNITVDFPDEDKFISTFKEKDVQYIIAIRPSKKNLLENNSNIAKHCLNALILRCFNSGIDLKINIL